MLIDRLPPDSPPYEAAGLPVLYGRDGYWVSALPMPLTSTLWHSLVALPHPGRGYHKFAEPGEVPVSFENDDGGDVPHPMLLETGRWLIENDAAVERAIVAALLADQDGFDEPSLRPMIRLLGLVIHEVKGRLPYFGAELACSWEEEHGAGIMFHGTEAIQTGGGDVPNLAWIALRHAEGRL